MGLGLVEFHRPYGKNEFTHIQRKKDVDYFYVEDGFFDLQNSIGNLLFTMLHLMVIPAFYILIASQRFDLLIISTFYFYVAAIGITVGSHRLWAHRAFEAKFPLRLFLMLAQSSAGVFSIRTWFMNHVTHHKWSDTDADPHNIKRGLFFSHGFWLFKKRHPLNFLKAETLDPTSLMSDPLVRLNHQYFDLWFAACGIAIPTLTGHLITGHPLVHCFLICYVLKHVMVMQIASLLNSAAHLFGDKPYNHKIMATDDNVMAKFTLGEGYHNYHHAFPSDYSTGEFGPSFLDLTFFIDAMAAIGQAYNLKRTSDSIVNLTKSKTQLRRSKETG